MVWHWLLFGKGMNNLVLELQTLMYTIDGYSEGDSGNVDGFEGMQIRETSTKYI